MSNRIDDMAYRNAQSYYSGLMIDRVPLGGYPQLDKSLKYGNNAYWWNPTNPVDLYSWKHDFWSTPPREIDDPTREVLEVSFSGERLINTVAVAVAHFPHTLTAQWWYAPTSQWLPFSETGDALGTAVSNKISDSIPSQIGSDQNPWGNSRFSIDHPQHYGEDHWVGVVWKVSPVTTTKVRFILFRSAGVAPWNRNNYRQERGSGYYYRPAQSGFIPYSLGLKDVQVGYRVKTRLDIPITVTGVTNKDFGSSIDLLGSRVLFSLTEQTASNVMNPDGTSAWRSEPQPVNYAVVNFYADTRDQSGYGQVIDKFFIDPLTVGSVLNLYYSNDVPTGRFQSLDQSIDYPISKSMGASSIGALSPQQTEADKVVFSGNEFSYVDIDNAYLQFDPTRPWWIGLEQEATTGANGIYNAVADHPWISFGGNTLRLNGGRIEFTSATGKMASVPLDIDHSLNARFSLAAVFNPDGTDDDKHGGYPDGLSLIYSLTDRPPVSVTWAMNSADLGARPTVFSIGRYNEEGTPGFAAMSLRALVLKVDAPPQQEEIKGFAADGSLFAKRNEFASLDTGQTDNALLRMHPSFSVAATNPVGLVGGPGDHFSEIVWTPISRDYALRRGMLNLPPTKARFFKFEFTQLVAEHYESFVPISRTVKIFQSGTVKEYEAMASGTTYTPSTNGTESTMNSDLPTYHDDLITRWNTPHIWDPLNHYGTEAWYASHPIQHSKLTKSGWVWNYDSWHVGAIAPQFVFTQKHTYETVSVDHVTKVAYFAGLKGLQAYRLNYMVDDQTEIYHEHFHDKINISSSNGMTWGQNQVTSFASSGQVESKTFLSPRQVRAVQFSSVQTDNRMDWLPDDGFVDPDLSHHWSVYGDATLTRKADRSVLVNRGWFLRSYSLIESTFPLYGAMEGQRYYNLEGAMPNGMVGGGINSEQVTPGDSGCLYAAAKVSSVSTLSAPVRLEIVSVLGNVVLASAQRTIHAGQQEDFYVSYTVPPVSNPLPYSLVDGVLYSALDLTTYGDHQKAPIVGNVFARLIQPGPTKDSFVVRRLSMFDAALTWEFSNDGGLNWFEAMSVRNDPYGVLSFPELGNELRWRLRTFRAGTKVSALAFRPWYKGLPGSMSGNSGHRVLGPNRSVKDEYPDIRDDPMWKQSSSPIPTNWVHPGITPIQMENEVSRALTPIH